MHYNWFIGHKRLDWRLCSYHSWRKSDCVGFHTDTQLSLSDTQLKHCECESIHTSTDVNMSQ